MSDDLLAKVSQLLAELPPTPVRRVRREIEPRGPIGLAVTVFRAATDLVAELNYRTAMNDWEDRQARLREFDDLLSAGLVNDATRREAVRAEIEALRLNGFVGLQRTAVVSSALEVLTRDVATIVRGCGERVATAAARPDDCILARTPQCAQIDAETLRVLQLHDHTAVISVGDMYNLVRQRN
ncbi:hypothetical protein [Mycobacterium intracellulare]|uniref:Uncharacterized protein n=1 Tax=Mycobacterium intracellulare TaxID=1767 RepID=A0AAE4REW4_MYCIT|nr:hypothetical protein [Mycobacterium intracellulare]MDV6979143.1 hypothetical protein [Mycobacterium intracellulare]MDV6984551.1 hypothetical protein [Mycobacterium intracellulare]MDV7014551.1 hypothetical protein [Mycobacterium intracellulare]MDV7029467.1 hypothetical protein [Mycobacterium intracellulare]